MIIENVIAEDNYQLGVTARDGRTGVFDVRPYLSGEAFTSLKDVNEFRKVMNGGYFIAWDCGADLSADTIEARWEPSTAELPSRTLRPETRAGVR